MVDAEVGGGDSGAPVFRRTRSPQDDDVRLMGILWGGIEGESFVYSKMNQIQNELGPLSTCAAGFNC